MGAECDDGCAVPAGCGEHVRGCVERSGRADDVWGAWGVRRGRSGVCGCCAAGCVDLGRWCGACQDLVGEGIKETESFLCHGLSSALSAVCYAGAPICEAVLDDGCNDLVHYLCDTSCMATWVCHGFHACNSGPSSSCCR